MSRRTRRTAQDLLAELLNLLGPDARLLHAHEREWASITFTGARHRFVFELPDASLVTPAVRRAIAGLPEHEFTVRGEIVADCTATLGLPMPNDQEPAVRLLVIELLTVVAD